ncbi:twin-arginine translocation pathway signal [Undibacterium sp. TJN25]|uniref:twin-arginine translocation pathway signal n=1 Tax=Undibacterium sp. TJN25 TaxID=3413056 RepID=UPI003BF43829
MNMKIRHHAMLAMVTAMLLSACAMPAANKPAADAAPPLVFVHGNGDTAALWQTTLWRYESNGWPRERLFAIDFPNPLARDEDDKLQPGHTSTTEQRDYLEAEIDKVLKTTGASQVVLIANSRGGNAVRNLVQTEYQAGPDAVKVSHAILGGTPNHGVWAIKGLREANEFSGTGPFLSMLNAPKNATGDEVTGPVKWMTVRSDNNDKYAQPDGIWIGAKGTPTNIPYTGPELKGASNIVIAGLDHRETSYSPAAFAAAYKFITGAAPASLEIKPEARVRLSGKVSGLGADPKNAASGNYGNNLPLPGAQLDIYAVETAAGKSPGARIGGAAYSKHIGSDGLWGPFDTQPGTAYEFVISAPGYAVTHIYRSPFPRSSNIVHLRAERIADSDKEAKSIVILTRPRGYLDAARDKMLLDGKAPPGLPPAGAGLSASKLKLPVNAQRSISAEFNGEKVYGQTWDATQGHLVFLEISQ